MLTYFLYNFNNLIKIIISIFYLISKLVFYLTAKGGKWYYVLSGNALCGVFRSGGITENDKKYNF